MSADIDFSQFKRKSSPASQADDIDFSQYKRKPERSAIAKGGRVAAQFGLGAAERALMPYELAVEPLKHKQALQVPYREELLSDLEQMQMQKASGNWSGQDQQMYDSLLEQVQNPEKAEEFIKPVDISVRGLSEKATGLDLHPEGVLEKGANFMGLIKNPGKATNLIKAGVKPKELLKAISPTGKEAMRGLGAGYALQIAESGGFGPIGTMGALVAGDLLGHGIHGFGKAVRSPKESLAKIAALSVTKDKKAIIRELEEASKGKPFTKDLGTLTGNRVVQMVQARMAASGLVGKPLQELRKKITEEIVGEYEGIANELGAAEFETIHEAGEIGKQGLADIQEAERARISEIYSKANERLTEGSVVNPMPLASKVNQLEQKLKPGAVKSTEQKAVLSLLEDLKQDMYDQEGNLRPMKVKDILNTKAALNDIINYESQGGQKKLLKQIVHELDKLALSHGAVDREFLKEYATANEQYGKHAKTFRNKNISAILKSDPKTLMNKMNTVQGIRDIRKALEITPQGKEIFDKLARKKLDLVFEKNLKDGVSEQLKTGKFANALEHGSNREIVKELLPKESYKRLVGLQKHAGELAETAQKFFNASQSATAVADMAVLATIVKGFGGLLTGNPWGLSYLGGVAGVRILSNLIADPKFLSLVEDAIKASAKNDTTQMNRIARSMTGYLKEVAPGIVGAETQ